ncbi:Dot/Icm T4SS effector LegT [Legionella sp. 29fVS95]|uniref:Dot/Icm T4SS effector LegT n=1 Tax=Legionella sp. 29fVS95 TaxID=3402813 RepID=UPI003AF571F7
MNRSARIITSFFLFLVAFFAYAGKDPIAWRVSNTFPAQTSVGQTYTIVYTFTNQLPFSLVRPLVIEHLTSPSVEFIFNDQCTGRLLASGASCTVTVALNPLVIGQKSLKLTIAGYSRDRVPLPEITTIATGQSLSAVTVVVTDSLPFQVTNGSSSSYKFTFTNNSAIDATSLSVDVTQTLGIPNHTSTCIGTLPANGGTCYVEGTYTVTSTTPSIQEVTARLSYSGPPDSPVQMSTLTQVVNPAAPLVGTVVTEFALPPLIVQNSVHQVQFLFTATGSVDIPGGATISCDQGGNDCSATLSAVAGSCLIPQTLTNAACLLTVTFTAPAANNPPDTYVLTAQVPYSVGGVPQPAATAITSGSVVAALPTSRTVTLVNDCDFDVWFSLNGSSLTSTPNCPTQACPAGTSCNTSTHKCYWNNPPPNIVVAPQAYLLTASGGTNNVTIDVNPGTDPSIQWSGNISASTLCNGTSSCQQASCSNNGGSTACAPGVGFTQPATQAEITMNLTSADSYDVEVINGFHIPISMQPVYYQSGATSIPATPNNYNCGTPGNNVATNGFGACNWNNAVVPVINQVPGNGFYWVTNGGTSCSITAGNQGCPANTFCGLDSSFNQVCGNFLGYWSADQVCGASPPAAVQSYFKCNQALPTATTPFYPSGAVLSNLMLCAVPTGYTGPRYNTCYNAYPGYSATDIAQCCGCADWWNPAQTNNVAIAANSNTQSCTQVGASQPQTNAQWNSLVQPMIQWMKQACPSAYVYPFDDKTSGFGCTNNINVAGEPNSTSYIITFCPGGITGLPAGINEGRG